MLDSTDHIDSGAASDRLQRYTYKPLQSPDIIRILCLDPSDLRTTPLSGSIVHVSRDAELSRPSVYSKYAAVSYTWGAAEFSCLLRLQEDAVADKAYISITPEVNQMLVELRKHSAKRYLWIDAICLNQEDDVEKSEQIPLMGQIYSQARKVIFWLGMGSDDDTAKIFAYFRYMALDPEGFITSDIFKDKETALESLNEFFQRPWFFRRWILQEATRARHGALHSGSHAIPWSPFLSACQSDLHIRLLSHPQEYGLNTVRSLSQKTHNLGSLLWHFHRSACSDERDRIAVLYGLLPRERQSELDYTMPYQDIYKQHAIAMLDESTQHELLLHLSGFGALPAGPDHGFPSWVPDWSKVRSSSLPFFLPTLYATGESFPKNPLSYKSGSWMQARSMSHSQRIADAHDWQIWRDCSIQEDWRWSYGTILAERKDANGKSVLSLSWIATWDDRQDAFDLPYPITHDEAYGKTVMGVATFSEPCDLVKIAKSFAPLCSDFHADNVDWPMVTDSYLTRQEDPAFLHNLGPLVASLEKIVSLEGSKTLAHWEDPKHRRFILTHALDKALNGQPHLTQSLAKLVKDGGATNDGFKDFINKLESPAAELLDDIVLELGSILYQNGFAIGELLHEDGDGHLALKTYMIGPCSLDRGMMLIPLHTHHWSNLLWAEHAKEGDLKLTWANAMVVKPVNNIAPLTPKATMSEGKSSSALPPNQATCVGLRMLPLLKPKLARAGSEGTHLTHFGKDWVQRKYVEAGKNGQPPPFTIDIVWYIPRATYICRAILLQRRRRSIKDVMRILRLYTIPG